MTVPSYVQASTGATDPGGAWTATGAAGTSGNVVILQIAQDGTTADVMGTPPSSGSDDTRITCTNVASIAGTSNRLTYIGAYSGGGVIQHLWIGRLVNTSAPTAAAGNTTSEDLYWRWYEVSNVNTGTTLAEVIEHSGGTTPTSTSGIGATVSDSGATTTGYDRLPLQLVALSDDNAAAPFTGTTSGSWAEAVAEYAEASGTDATIQLQIGSTFNLVATTAGYADLCYGNSYFLSVGGSGRATYCYLFPLPQDANLESWTNNAAGSGNNLGCTYGNGYFVIAGPTGTIYYRASDPTGAWSSTTAGSGQHTAVAYGDDGYWVVVGDAGSLYYKASTPDGTWTSNAQGTTTFNDVHYANGYWVAVGDTGTLYYATDPTGTWTSNSLGGAGHVNAVHYGNGYWAAACQAAGFYYKASTPDGTWTSKTTPDASSANQAVYFANRNWVVAGAQNVFYTNADLTDEWSRQPGPASTVIWAGGYWVAIDSNGDVRYQRHTVIPLPGSVGGGTFTQADATDGWNVVGFALIGPGANRSLPPARRTPIQIYR